MAQIRITWIDAPGGAPVIRTGPIPDRVDGDAVRIAVAAAALNFADLLQAEGRYQERLGFPHVPGLEGAGTVIEAGPEARLAPGTRVAVVAPGMMAGQVVVSADACRPLPAGMSDAVAAGFQIAYGTSHLALTDRAGLRAGETLVVLGAAGGVGLTAVEIGAALGARVIGVARGADRLRAVRAAGAAEAIDSAATPDLRAALRDLGGADVVYDAVGAEAGEAAFAALRPGGRFLVIGFAAGRPPVLALNHALVKNIAIHGLYWGGLRTLDAARYHASLDALFAMAADGRLRPAAPVTFPLDRVAEAFARLRERTATGKIVVTMTAAGAPE